MSSPAPVSEQEFWSEFDQRDWTAAIAAAARLVEAARTEAAQEPLALARALSLLGQAQFAAADYTSAEAAFTEALEVIEQHGRTMSAEMLDPLRGLGYTMAAGGRHEDAAALLERALIVAHRNYGLFDIGQQGVLRQLAGSLTKTGRVSEAERHVNYLLRVAERTYGESSAQLAPTLCIVGEWYAEVAAFSTARDAYRRAFELVQQNDGEMARAAVEPLRGLARTYTRELHYATLGIRARGSARQPDAHGAMNDRQPLNPRYLNPEGEKALLRALAILEGQPEAPREQLIGTLIQLGDWMQTKRQPARALLLYQRASQLIGADEEAERTGPLSFPVRLWYVAPFSAARRLAPASAPVEESYVEVEFTVTRHGEVTGARVVDRSASERHAAESLEAIRGARYRPRFVEGEPVDTPGVTFREVFRARSAERADAQS